MSTLDSNISPSMNSNFSANDDSFVDELMMHSSPNLQRLKQAEQMISSSIVGQAHLVERMLLALLCNGHILVEGAPGLAKTRAIRTLSEVIEGNFHRIQFTPDLLPSDLTGTDIYRQETGEFVFQPGPLFNNLVLADEINRAPAKVQSSLLEAMAEKQITVGKKTYPMSDLFLVMATQNPIEQEGTYPLPEAQLDRFLMHIKVDYPSADSERQILRLVDSEQQQKMPSRFTLSQLELNQAKQEILNKPVPESVENYIIQLIHATRQPANYDADLAQLIQYGASPRGTIALLNCARALAWLNEQPLVTSLEVQQVIHDVLRHRILVSLEADAQQVTSDQLIDRISRSSPRFIRSQRWFSDHDH